MVVSFVNAGLLTLAESISVIMGANIGTTVTAWIISIFGFKVDMAAFALPLLAIALPLIFSGKSNRKSIGEFIFGFSFLFMGLSYLKANAPDLNANPEMLAFVQNYTDMGFFSILLFLFIGTILTMIVQASAATMAITLIMCANGWISLELGAALVLGENIGTTITAVLASIGTDRTAKQACAAHVLFNVIGVCIFLTILPLYQELIAMTATGIAHQIANAHTLFNVFNTIIFLTFVKPFAALIRRLLPDKAHKVVEGAQYLDPKLIEATPGIAVEAVKNECAYMGFLVIHLLDSVQEVFFNDKKDLIPKIEETEAKIDQLHKAVKAYAEDIMQAGISDDAARVLTLYVASSGNIERIGDYGKKLLEYYAYRQNRPKDFSQQAMTELSGMYAEAHHAIVTALDGFINDDPDKAREVAPIAGKLRGLEVELRNRHIQRLDKQECDSETGLVYVDILGIIEHIGYHSNNVAKATISSCTAEHKARA